MRHDPIPLPLAKAPDAALELLDRERLIRRWQCGSDSFFWRAEEAGLLLPRHIRGLLRYAWPDVFAFEGGPPPPGLEETYQRDLLTAAQVARLCACSEATIRDEVRAGRLAVRRIGRVSRFVPAEVRRWQERPTQRRRRRR
ncbi:helix-turn-helix domain-containing protein [uncultured Jannaschia sp.]|uniref:helix-turn-helix domain-containing protein n=1 Tax=uncultured Jannaschia sp. TaxID=293347 RepID=UPI00262F202B|nr:helix-turn-helix domain-containing protein [uncultured Jannaschia sp.]